MELLRDMHATKDWLGRTAALATLNHAIQNVTPPACIALYGSWGTGKTSMLRHAERHWGAGAKHPELPKNRAIWFDTWEHDQRGDVVSPLLWTIAKHAAAWNPEEHKQIARLAILLGMVAVTVGAHAGATVAGVALKEVQEAWEKLGKWGVGDIKKFFEEPKRYANQIDDAKKQFNELVELALAGTERGSRLVIFLDDLDRCLPFNVVTLLEATKLLLCGSQQAPVVFVFGLDRTIVGEAIAQRYPGSSLYTGESYLEKVFDVSVEVPPVGDAELETFLAVQRVPEKARRDLERGDKPLAELEKALTEARGVLKTEFDFVGGYEALAQTLLLPAFANPRVMKRCLNRLSLLKVGESAARAAVEEAAAKAGAEASAKAERPEDIKALREKAEKEVRGAFVDTKRLLGGNESAQSRFLLWLAGAERFRGFRHAFMTASDLEIAAFHTTCFPRQDEAEKAGVPIRLGDGLKRVIGTPSFLKFYEGLVGGGLAGGGEMSVEAVNALRGCPKKMTFGDPTIGQIDAHLRRYGV